MGKKKLTIVGVMVVLIIALVAVSSASELITPQAMTYLKAWSSSMDHWGNGDLYISGYTESYVAVSKIEILLTIQRWDGQIWQNYRTFSASQLNSQKVSLGHLVTVPKGYYYRIKGDHHVYNGITESAVSYTPYQYVN